MGSDTFRLVRRVYDTNELADSVSLTHQYTSYLTRSIEHLSVDYYSPYHCIGAREPDRAGLQRAPANISCTARQRATTPSGLQSTDITVLIPRKSVSK